jgi:hypothetical protein
MVGPYTLASLRARDQRSISPIFKHASLWLHDCNLPARLFNAFQRSKVELPVRTCGSMRAAEARRADEMP